MIASEIYAYLDQQAPFQSALSFDNCGLLVGDPQAEVSRCLLCLDVTGKVIDEAVSLGAQLIISHHPVIFAGLKQIRQDSLPARLIRHGLTVISAHTNLDLAEHGVNYQLAKACGLELFSLQRLPADPAAQADGFGLTGTLPKALSPWEFAAAVKAALQSDSIKYTDGGRPVRTVAVSCGSGGFLLEDVLTAETDALVTAEVKHHQFLLAQEAGLTLLDAGHFETENIILPPLCEALEEAFPQAEFLISRAGTNPVRYL